MKKNVLACIAMTAALAVIQPLSVSAYENYEKKTSVQLFVKANGMYNNWDGVTNVAQFVGDNGEFCFAYDKGDNVIVVRTNGESALKKTITLKKQAPIFGTVICDKDGNYYVVTGKENKTKNTNIDTIFISKYDSSGKHIKTVGDNGSSSLAYYYDSGFYTQLPFDAGNCDAAISGNILAVNYGRSMYSGHQSNSVFAVNIKDMSEADLGVNYNSHSFAQRVISHNGSFVFASEGDCYNRAFTIGTPAASNKENASDIFHFWVKKGTLDKYNMGILNNNFAHMGGLASVNNKYVAFVGTSAKSLNSNAADENEQLFIQIFDPSANLGKASSYVTSGTRSGLSGGNGDENVTDYGIKWLTNYKKVKIRHPQVVATDSGKIVVLYEKYARDYYGVYYIVLDSKGEVIQKSQLFSKTARLNPCEMPVYVNGRVYWAGNNKSDGNKNVHIFSIEID